MQTSAVRLSLILYFSVGRSSTELYPPLATASDTKIKSKTVNDRTCQTRRLHFLTPHWVHTNSSTVVSWDSQTVKLKGRLFFCLSLSLSAALYHGLLLSEDTFTLGFMTPSSPGFTATSLGFPPILLCSLTSPLGRYAGHGPRLYFLPYPHSQMRNLFQVHGFS